MKKPRWTNAELLTLGDLYRDGLSYNQIAVKMNRSRSAVAYALNQYRNVINVQYKRKPGAGRKPAGEEIRVLFTREPEPEKKPWWKFW